MFMETIHTLRASQRFSRFLSSLHLVLFINALLLSAIIPVHGVPPTPPKPVATKTSRTASELSLFETLKKQFTDFASYISSSQNSLIALLANTTILFGLMKKFHDAASQGTSKRTTSKQSNVKKTSPPTPPTKRYTAPSCYGLGSCKQINSIPQEVGAKDCGIHALANAAAIDQCLAQGKPVVSTYVKNYHSTFHQKALKALQAEGRSRSLTTAGLYPDDIVLIAKKHFSMNNLCVLFRPEKAFDIQNACYTTNQTIQEITTCQKDNSGDATNNHSLHTMMQRLKQKNAGAVHLVCHTHCPYVHWVLISFIKEPHTSQISTVYVDSVNNPFTAHHDTKACVTFAQNNYGKKIA